MAGPNRTSWKPGESGNRKGRPPRNYSISHALSVVAETPESIDDDGNPITKAKLAADWLWQQVFNTQLGFKDRLAALQTILSRIEPDYKLTDRNFHDDAEAEDTTDGLKRLEYEELKELERLMKKAAQTE